MEEVKATIKNETSKDPDEAALKEFATQLKARHMTPEAFYRLCDGASKQSISTNLFKKQMRSLGLKLQETQMRRLCLIFDEDLEDSITYQEYQDALLLLRCQLILNRYFPSFSAIFSFVSS